MKRLLGIGSWVSSEWAHEWGELRLFRLSGRLGFTPYLDGWVVR